MRGSAEGGMSPQGAGRPEWGIAQRGKELSLQLSLVDSFPHLVKNMPCDAEIHWLCPWSSWERGYDKGYLQSHGISEERKSCLGQQTAALPASGGGWNLSSDQETGPCPRQREEVGRPGVGPDRTVYMQGWRRAATHRAVSL